MNSKIAEKLVINPHYKMSKKQREEADKVVKDAPLIQFGKPQFHPHLEREEK